MAAARTVGEAPTSARTTVANGIVVTLNDADDVVVGGTVVFDGDRIAMPARRRCPQPAGTVIDAGGMAVLPGLVDLHYHTAIGKGGATTCPCGNRSNLLVPGHPGARRRGRLLGSAGQLLRVGQMRCDHGERHVPPPRGPGPGGGRDRIGCTFQRIADPEHDLDSLDDTRAA